MKQSVYIERFTENANAMIGLTTRKNADYAGTEDAFKNFRAIEYMTGGRISMADGILVRMSDKFMRIANLMGRAAQVADEAVTDTCFDMAVYSLILKLALEAQDEAMAQEPVQQNLLSVTSGQQENADSEPLGTEGMRDALLQEAESVGGVGNLHPVKRWLLETILKGAA